MGSNKHKSCEIDKSTEEVGDDQSIEGRRKRQCWAHKIFVSFMNEFNMCVCV